MYFLLIEEEKFYGKRNGKRITKNYNTKNTRELPLLPLRGVLVYPYMVIHLDVGRDKSVKAVEEAMIQEREIFLATQIEAKTDNPGQEDIYRMGCIAEVKQLLRLPGGNIRVLVEGLRRGEIIKYLNEGPVLFGKNQRI